MQFTTKLTEEDYVAACRLKLKSVHRTIASAVAYTLASIFWTFLIAAWIFRLLHPRGLFLNQNVPAFQTAVLPGAVAFLLWILVFRVYVPYANRRKFRRAKNLHGEMFTEINSEGLMQKTAEGSYGFSRWADYSFWRESEQIFIVVYPTNVFCLLPKSAMSAEQQSEIRTILTAALPEK
jgi:hypothetical protein